jgi:hypothetical protein
MTYLVVGLDRSTLAPWHANVCARDVTAAKRIAHARAGASGLNLIVASTQGAGGEAGMPALAARPAGLAGAS